MFFISISAIKTQLYAIIAIIVVVILISFSNEKHNKPIEPRDDVTFVIGGSLMIIAILYFWPKFIFLGLLLWSLIYGVKRSLDKIFLSSEMPNASI